MKRTEQSVLAALVIGLLVGGVATYAVTASLSPTSGSSTSTLSTGESSSTISPAPCALPYRAPPSNVTTLANGTQVTESAIPAFVMGTGSTMELCLEYTNAVPSIPHALTPTIAAVEWGSCYPTCNSPARNFSTNASPVSILFSRGESIVVEYTVSAGENSTGFVGLSEGYYLECASIPVAVGYPSSQVNASDFPGYGSAYTFCPPSPVEAQIIGYTGGSLLYLAEDSPG